MPQKTTPVVIAHAPADTTYAQFLAEFLETGCDVRCDLKAGRLEPDEHLVDLVAGHDSDQMILLLSQDSWPATLPRDRWDPVLLDRPLACVLVNPCPYPKLLERRTFFRGEQYVMTARGVKRWLWQQLKDPAISTHYQWTSNLEDLYGKLADRPGTHAIAHSGEQALQFAREAVNEFECVIWLPCAFRTLAETMGELGSILGMTLDGQERENRLAIHEMLALRRCLIVLDAPSTEIRSALTAFGRSSTLITPEPVEIRETPCTFEYGRKLVGQKRYAEAYDVFYGVMNQTGDPEQCAPELAWICDHWGRTAEAEKLRAMLRHPVLVHQPGLFD